MNPTTLQEEFKVFCSIHSSMIGRLSDNDVNRLTDWWLQKLSERDSLEQLIEKCGDDFSSLDKMEEEWWARGHTKKGAFESSGLTPHEAVKKLFNVLKKNDMEIAYKLAKSAGYEGRVYAPNLGAELLDPLFWQALGKSLRWEDTTGTYHEYNIDRTKSWLVKWHQFVDHLTEGKSAHEFFESLIPK